MNSVEQQLCRPATVVDLSDPWAGCKTLRKSQNATKAKCADCDYMLYRPFEIVCPLPQCFEKQNTGAVKTCVPAVPPAGASGKAPAKEEASSSAGKDKKSAKKDKKGKEPAAATAAPAGGELAGDFAKCKLQISRIVSAEPHPNADTLYVCSVETGPDEFRPLVSGIVKYYKPEQLVNRLIVSIVNLKASKLRGVESQVMLLAGSDKEKDIVSLLTPPEGSVVGDRVFVEGGKPSEETPKQLSSKVWQRVVAQLSAKGGIACLGESKLVTAKGPLTVTGVPDGAGIH